MVLVVLPRITDEKSCGATGEPALSIERKLGAPYTRLGASRTRRLAAVRH